ncbi:MAG: ornithine carbamoyltransferase [Candidatus Aenigmarchaeota archaeon]|nr:ornithine carbamoyltransferase [Candidatus Aenigmarchaeota archaeon]
MRNFLTLEDVTREEIFQIFKLAKRLKRKPWGNQLKDKIFALLFFKPSTRTRVSFEAGIKQLGGEAIYLDYATTQLARGESVEDAARTLERYVNCIIARVYEHKVLERMAKVANIPIINALSNLEHPCQILSDLFTIQEHFGKFDGLKLTYVGDGGNNIAHSLLLGCSKIGLNLTISCPKQYAPNPTILQKSLQHSLITGTKIDVLSDPHKAVKDSDIIYTDVWVSMGMEKEVKKRLETLQPYQVNESLVKHANPSFIFMHCLPYEGREVIPDIIYGPHSIVWQQAENRLHVGKALLVFLMKF